MGKFPVEVATVNKTCNRALLHFFGKTCNTYLASIVYKYLFKYKNSALLIAIVIKIVNIKFFKGED